MPNFKSFLIPLYITFICVFSCLDARCYAASERELTLSVENDNWAEIQNKLRENKSATTLRIDVYSDCSAKVLADVLTANKNFTTIFFSHYKFCAEEGKAFAEVLRVCKNLKTLEIYSKFTMTKGIEPLAKELSANKTLTNLSLCYRVMEGADALAEALKVNQSLKSLRCESSWGFIPPEGFGKEIADVIKVNQTLESLNLFCNPLGKEGLEAVAEALKVNQSLKTLRLTMDKRCFDPTVYYKAIEESLKYNETLTTLNMVDFKLSAETEGWLKTNKILEDLSRRGCDISVGK